MFLNYVYGDINLAISYNAKKLTFAHFHSGTDVKLVENLSFIQIPKRKNTMVSKLGSFFAFLYTQPDFCGCVVTLSTKS